MAVSDKGDGEGERAGWISLGRIAPRGGGEGGIAIRSREEEDVPAEENEVDHVIVLSRNADHSGICGTDVNIDDISPGRARLGVGDNVDSGRLECALAPEEEVEADAEFDPEA